MSLYACVFALGFTQGILVGAYQFGIRSVIKVLEGGKQ